MKVANVFLAAAILILSACSMDGQKLVVVDMSQEVDSSVDGRARQILARMTLEEKIGQILQADISAVTPDEAKAYNLGSVLNGGNSAPGGGKVAAPIQWIELADEFWLASTDTTDGGIGLPLLWGTDAVHGHNNLQSATIFPHNSGLGAANDPALLKEIAQVTAREIRATGLDWTFAPTLAVATDDRWGRAYESYSENPEIVAAYAGAFVEGLQGEAGSEGFLRGDHVIATAKHFLGDGGTQYGIDRGDTIGDWDEILHTHGAGYFPAIEADVQTVMASFSSVNGEKIHGSKWLLTDVLRGELGFDGFVVGDWNGHGEVPGCTPEDCLPALYAGLDMYMAPDSWKGLYNSMLAHAKSGELDLERLDEAVLRILRVKVRSGLLEAGLPSQRLTSRPEILGREDHRAVARRAVRQSLVLLKNDANLLPLAGSKTVMISGSGANSMQQQTGGWTLNWQGTGNENKEFLTGETVFAGVEAAMAARGGSSFLSTDGSFEEKPDAAIVVYGEEPYAEYRGDRTDLVYEFEDGSNLALVKKLKSQGIPVVSVFLTGRPLWVNPHLNTSDAFVVAWLPGTEAGGISDVLIGGETGEPRYDFSGKLSFSWPDNGVGEPINAATETGVLFPFGFGLGYSDTAEWVPLSEDPGLARDEFTGQIFMRGEAVAPFNLFLGDSSNPNTPVDALVGQSIGGAVSTRGLDYKAQEDARVFTWSGNKAGTAKLQAGRSIDLTRQGDPSEMFVQIEWQIISAPEGEFRVILDCGEGCEGGMEISQYLSDQPKEEWISSSFPLSCFVEQGLDPTKVQTAFSLSTDAKFSIALYAVSISRFPGTKQSCGKVFEQ
ncbi:glycoside hydrolase family 3 N-terminal domain-containing protein [Hyphomonas sp.]|jgi:beta-glucosidase|uniref:glycoside hydrolase family 3 protein n=1 Tax=Hyphomonas sp. TaxID=87 RepID=UPI0039E2517B